MTRPDWAPEDIDITVASAARMYDYYLGGAHNFAADRELAQKALAAVPEGRRLAQLNRAFLRRSVRYLARAGIRQFLDIGSGIPTVGNVHEVAAHVDPTCRVLYVDIDPVAVSHARAILAGDPNTEAIRGDLRDPDGILADPTGNRTLDLTQPVAILLYAVLHFIPDEADPVGLLGRWRDATAPGSWLVISHGTDDGRPTEELEGVYRRTVTPLTMRDRDAVRSLFAGYDLLPPGVVWAPQWHPDPSDDTDEPPERSGSYVGVGRRT